MQLEHRLSRCSNYIFILDLTPVFIGLGKDTCKTRRGKIKFGDMVRLILESLMYIVFEWAWNLFMNISSAKYGPF